ncbi:TPA: hypothetical protein HA273_05750 [Candidatus Bathyarchaeota archaeon]|nr:hypothetical protein [Candidatus Bathyarchaeota archaeon]
MASFSTILVKGYNEAPKLQWTKTYGPYLAYSVIQTKDGGFAIAGQNASYKPFSPHSPPDWRNYTARLIKTDNKGNVTWEKTYEAEVGYGSFSSEVNVVQTEDLGYALCGGDWLLKLNANGDLRWKKTYSSLELEGLAAASDGGYALIGNTKVVEPGDSGDVVIIKTDQEGNTLWNRTFSTGLPFRHDVIAKSLEETNDKGYAIAGGWNGNFWFAKTDADGNVNLNKTYSLISSGGAGFTSVSQTTDGGYILSGFSDDPTQRTTYSGWVVKTDAQGNPEWNYHYVQSGFGALFRSIAQLADGGYVAGGEPALIVLDSLGKLKWNSTSYDAYCVLASRDGGFLVAGGQGDLVSPDQEVWIAEFASESPTPPDKTDSLSPTMWIVVALVTVTIVAVGLVVYFKKYKRK